MNTPPTPWVLLVLSSTPALFLAGCGDSPTGLPTGAIRVVTKTTGSSLDADGYVITVDGQPYVMGINATRTFGALEAGKHEVELKSLAPNCTLAGSDPQTVAVAMGDTSSASFDLDCQFVRRELAFTRGCAVVGFEDPCNDGGSEIYAMDADGSGVVRLTDHQGQDYDPAWSPDGTKIAFTTDRDGDEEIYVMDAGGSNPARLTDNPARDYGPAWSPDGTKIAFTTDRDGNSEVYVMDTDGSDPMNLTNDDADDYGAAWSPDGTQIAFVSDRDGNAEIYTMAADGSDIVRLTDDPDLDYGPAWSPDGTKIAFTNATNVLFEGPSEIYVVDVGTPSPVPVRLTNAADLGDAGSPAWSPDGTRIVFVAPGGGDFGWAVDLWVMDADGSNAVKLTSGDASSWAPAWSPYEMMAAAPVTAAAAENAAAADAPAPPGEGDQDR